MLRYRKSPLIILALLALASQTCTTTKQTAAPSEVLDVIPTTQQTAAPSQVIEALPTATQVTVSTPASPEVDSQISKTVNAITGGEVVLSTTRGDTIQLAIPAFALHENTTITIIAYSQPLDSPFSKNFFTGFGILPDGIPLRLPATITFTLSTHTYTPGERIFYLKSSNLALPLWQSALNANSFTGKISHFSQYIGGSPTDDEALGQAAASSELGGEFPGGWRDSLEGNQAMGEWGNTLNEMGFTNEGDGIIDQARDRLAQDIDCLLDPGCSPQPEDPCGEYLHMVLYYYQQAILLGFDSESAMMQSLYSLVEDVLNQCTNRYSLVYNHNLSANQMGVQQDMLVTGEVIFTAPMYGAGDLGGLKLQGAGTTSVTITGQMDKGDEVCTISGEGSNAVSITGELVADEMGNPGLALEVNEQWYTSGSLTVVCPDEDAQTAPLPALPGQKFNLDFPYQDSAQITQPNVGGLEGEYNWTLHILHSW